MSYLPSYYFPSKKVCSVSRVCAVKKRKRVSCQPVCVKKKNKKCIVRKRVCPRQKSQFVVAGTRQLIPSHLFSLNIQNPPPTTNVFLSSFSEKLPTNSLLKTKSKGSQTSAVTSSIANPNTVFSGNPVTAPSSVYQSFVASKPPPYSVAVSAPPLRVTATQIPIPSTLSPMLSPSLPSRLQKLLDSPFANQLPEPHPPVKQKKTKKKKLPTQQIETQSSLVQNMGPLPQLIQNISTLSRVPLHPPAKESETFERKQSVKHSQLNRMYNAEEKTLPSLPTSSLEELKRPIDLKKVTVVPRIPVKSESPFLDELKTPFHLKKVTVEQRKKPEKHTENPLMSSIREHMEKRRKSIEEMEEEIADAKRPGNVPVSSSYFSFGNLKKRVNEKPNAKILAKTLGPLPPSPKSFSLTDIGPLGSPDQNLPEQVAPEEWEEEEVEEKEEKQPEKKREQPEQILVEEGTGIGRGGSFYKKRKVIRKCGGYITGNRCIRL